MKKHVVLFMFALLLPYFHITAMEKENGGNIKHKGILGTWKKNKGENEINLKIEIFMNMSDYTVFARRQLEEKEVFTFDEKLIAHGAKRQGNPYPETLKEPITDYLEKMDRYNQYTEKLPEFGKILAQDINTKLKRIKNIEN